MSAETTIGILVTHGKQAEMQVEYRVALCQEVHRIIEEPDYPSAERAELNREWTRKLFASAPVFTSYDAAWKHAERKLEKILNDGGVVEYGIRVLDHDLVHFPSSDRKRERNRRFDRYKRRARAA